MQYYNDLSIFAVKSEDMAERTQYKNVAISEPDFAILEKLCQRYGMTKKDLLSLLLIQADRYGITKEKEGKPLTEFDRLRKSVKSFNDSAWSSIQEQRRNYADMMNRMAEQQKQLTSSNELLALNCQAIAELLSAPTRSAMSSETSAKNAENYAKKTADSAQKCQDTMVGFMSDVVTILKQIADAECTKPEVKTISQSWLSKLGLK